MRRIGRYILNGLTVLSLVLCVATVGLWVRSGWRRIHLSWTSSDTKVELQSAHGQLALEHYSVGRYPGVWAVMGRGFDASASEHVGTTEDEERGFDGPAGIVYHRAAFGFSIRRTNGGIAGGALYIPGWRVAVPHWFLALVLLAGPLIWGRIVWRRRRSRQRLSDGRCSACNYDLRATPDHCPECGTIPAKVKA